MWIFQCMIQTATNGIDQILKMLDIVGETPWIWYWLRTDPLGRSCGISFWEASGQDDIFIMFKASTQWRLIGTYAELLCKVNPFPQQSKISYTGNTVEDYEYNINNCLILLAKVYEETTKISEVTIWSWFKVTAWERVHPSPVSSAPISHTSLTLGKHNDHHLRGYFVRQKPTLGL